MRDFHIFIFCLFIYIITLSSTECKKDSTKSKNKRGYKNNKIKPKDEKYNLKKRKLQNDEKPEGRYNTSYVPLNISIDLTNFNETIPDSIKDYKDLFINSMMKAKEILEGLLYIEIDYDEIIILGENFFDINDIEFFDEKINNSRLYPYNYHILFKFDNSLDLANSEIIAGLVYVPAIGVIAINDENIKENQLNLEFLTNLMLHHFIHLLGFYQNESTDFEGIIKDYVIDEDHGLSVIKYAQDYFKCDRISEIELDVDGDDNVMWPTRLLLGELMTNFNDYPEEHILSGFTLALLDDLPYMKVLKKNIGSLMKFGKNKGCDFFYNECKEELVSGITFANEFNLAAQSKPSCSSGRLSKTIYKLNSDHPASNEYCIVAKFDEENDEDIYIGHCHKEESADNSIDDNLKESFTNHSFCVLSSLVPSSGTAEYKALCYEMFCSDLSLTIKIGDRYIVCPRSGGKIEVKDLNGYLLCPDYNLICSSTELCNNFFDCYNKSSEEKVDTFEYYYEIKTTQNSDYYDNDNDNPNIEDPITSKSWELTDEGKCPKLCMQCDAEFKCIQCAPTYKIYNTEENKCLDVVPNCIDYYKPVVEGEELCIKCDELYFLADIKNGSRICELKENENKYYKPVDSLIYKKCIDHFEYCEECQEEEIESEKRVVCSKCITNYELIDDDSFCGDITTNFYYLSDGKYISCTKSPLINNCNECQIENDEFECLKCKENYYFYHNNDGLISCINNIDDTMYSDDDENYYPCSKSLPNCETCNNKNTCTNCDSTTYLEESDKCILRSLADDDNLYYFESNINKYVNCSKISVQNCKKCTSDTTCTECQDANDVLVDDGTKCLNKDSKLFFIDTVDNDKKKSCTSYPSKPNCLKCELTDSNFKCLECEENYALLHNNDETITCIEKSTLTGNKYFTTDEKNYYPCDSREHSIDNCDECNTIDKCITCKSGYTTANENTKCILTSDIIAKKYYEEPAGSNNYYLCSESDSLTNCVTCEDKNTCNSCLDNYIIDEDTNHCVDKALFDEKKYYENEVTRKYKNCNTVLTNCEKCTSSTKCISCNSGLYLVKGNDDIFICKNIANINQYYKITEDVDFEYYKECSIENCDECTAIDVCTKCLENFAIIDDDSSKCEDLSTEKYYLDKRDSKYKLCSNGLPNCEKCFNDEENDNNFKCKLCITNYAFKHSEAIECTLRTDLETLKTDNIFYTNDTGINYYSCSLYNDARNCLKCDSKETCKECQSGFQFDGENKKICYSNEQEEGKLVTRDQNQLLVFCDQVMSGCQKCESYNDCKKCESNDDVILDDNQCIPKTQVENQDQYIPITEETEDGETIYKYISCSTVIENCNTCASSTVCISCAQGYQKNNDLCEKIIENNKNDDDDLATGAIIGIVFGCVGFLVIAALTVYYFLKRLIKSDSKQNDIEIVENEKKTIYNENNDVIKDDNAVDAEKQNEIIENEKQFEVAAHKKKREIHN